MLVLTLFCIGRLRYTDACLSCAGLPYNSIEVLILGNITNNGTTPINLKGGWIIIPFSMGVQTEYEGIWKRIADPNHYFKIFCWYALTLAVIQYACTLGSQ